MAVSERFRISTPFIPSASDMATTLKSNVAVIANDTRPSQPPKRSSNDNKKNDKTRNQQNKSVGEKAKENRGQGKPKVDSKSPSPRVTYDKSKKGIENAWKPLPSSAKAGCLLAESIANEKMKVECLADATKMKQQQIEDSIRDAMHGIVGKDVADQVLAKVASDIGLTLKKDDSPPIDKLPVLKMESEVMIPISRKIMRLILDDEEIWVSSNALSIGAITDDDVDSCPHFEFEPYVDEAERSIKFFESWTRIYTARGVPNGKANSKCSAESCDQYFTNPVDWSDFTLAAHDTFKPFNRIFLKVWLPILCTPLILCLLALILPSCAETLTDALTLIVLLIRVILWLSFRVTVISMVMVVNWIGPIICWIGLVYVFLYALLFFYLKTSRREMLHRITSFPELVTRFPLKIILYILTSLAHFPATLWSMRRLFRTALTRRAFFYLYREELNLIRRGQFTGESSSSLRSCLRRDFTIVEYLSDITREGDPRFLTQNQGPIKVTDMRYAKVRFSAHVQVEVPSLIWFGSEYLDIKVLKDDVVISLELAKEMLNTKTVTSKTEEVATAQVDSILTRSTALALSKDHPEVLVNSKVYALMKWRHLKSNTLNLDF